MKIKITTLSENTASHGFLAEWGFSALVEIEGTRILIDTGMSFTAAYNAQLLGIDLKSIDTIVLSHGHRDHTGGLRDILRRKQNPVKVIAHPDIWTKKYSCLDGKTYEYCGIPFSREVLESQGACFELSKKPIHITGDVMTSGEIPMVTGYETLEDNLFIKTGTAFQIDPLADDLALIIKTENGLVIILGCGHHGLINTLSHAQHLTGQKEVYAVIGGTHLHRASGERIDKTITDLKEMRIQKLGVSHCTGFHASARLAQEFGHSFLLNNAGNNIILP